MLIGFVGDTSFSGFFSEKQDIGFIDVRIINRLKNNHFNVVNLEGSLSNTPPLPRRGSTMGSPEKAELLKSINCNIFNLANNHIMDAGVQGLLDTKSIAEDNSILCFGAGENLEVASKPLFLKNNGVSVSIIGVSHEEGLIASESRPGVFSDKHRTKIRERILECKDISDWVIICYHGGEEFTFCPSPSKRDKLKSFIKDGADLVIAHHSHTVQGYENYRNGTIYYSLGNFIFDTPYQRNNIGTTQSVVLFIKFSKAIFQIKTLFTEIDRMEEKVLPLPSNENFREFFEGSYLEEWARDCGRYYEFFIGKTRRSLIINNSESKLAFMNKLTYLRPFLVELKVVFIFMRNLTRKGPQREIAIGFFKFKLQKFLGGIIS